jgi:hypothetical protein
MFGGLFVGLFVGLSVAGVEHGPSSHCPLLQHPLPPSRETPSSWFEHSSAVSADTGLGVLAGVGDGPGSAGRLNADPRDSGDLAGSSTRSGHFGAAVGDEVLGVDSQ